jgi:hypothetical protein
MPLGSEKKQFVLIFPLAHLPRESRPPQLPPPRPSAMPDGPAVPHARRPRDRVMVLLQFPQRAADGKTGGINFVGAELPIGNVWG